MMLTDHPHIVIARPPKRVRRKKAAQALAIPVIVGPKQKPPLGEDEMRPRTEAADRLWKELVQQATANKP